MGAEAKAVHLLGGPQVVAPGAVSHLAGIEARLVALLALTGCPVPRSMAAGRIWGDACQERATASLRTALWRLRQRHDGLVDGNRDRVWLGSAVTVDVVVARRRALAVVTDDDVAATASPGDFRRDLLPTLDDDWVALERERYRQLRLNALEAVAAANARRGRWARAIHAARLATSADPLRSSAVRTLVDAHVGAGDHAEARRVLRRHRRQLALVLGSREPPDPPIQPTRQEPPQ